MLKQTKYTFRCQKCGKKIEFNSRNEYDDNFDFGYNKCWILQPNHRQAGYGSKFDGSYFTIDLCDDCLYEFVQTFKHKEEIMNTGTNYCEPYEEYEDNIDELW